MKILALCGSLRRVSMNAALLRATARLAPAGMQVRIFDGLGELPLFNPDLEARLPAAVGRLHGAILDCEALLIASPEYAHGVTGVLKNALDWLVSFEGFVGKPVVIFNASPRSVHADAALREILSTMSANLIASACLALPLRGLNLSEDAMVASEHAAAIRAALLRLADEVPRP
ncbi:MAG TPA: NADPH-dependent FMN reductase [Steroidobacteraceae bacterium]|jgi:NAD(P)H-dependent FMN reductase|nr:NADPH-dependent FMN reductase [Steroidobacteraceae bacterium]